MLSVFVNDEIVGIYSFAAMLIEGLYQVPAVVRSAVNPVLVHLLQAQNKGDLARFGRRVMVSCLFIFTSCALPALFILPFLAPYLPNDLVSRAYPVFTVLLLGLAIYASFIPLEYLLMQAGQPGWQSMLMSLNILINAGLNLSLIPLFGIEGAALATAISFAVSGINLNIAVWWRLGLPGGLVLAETRLLKLLTPLVGGR